MSFSPKLGNGCRGVCQGIGTQPAYAVFHRGQLKNRILRNLCFFDMVTTQYDHPTYVKDVVGSIYEFFTLFGEWVQGGLPRDWYTTCFCNFSPWVAQKSKFAKLIFMIS